MGTPVPPTPLGQSGICSSGGICGAKLFCSPASRHLHKPVPCQSDWRMHRQRLLPGDGTKHNRLLRVSAGRSARVSAHSHPGRAPR